MFLRSVEGNYIPSFFIIQMMSTSANIDVINDNTFIHEYIHFLQDLIFPYCIRLNMSYLHWFKNVCIVAKNNNQINIPFDNWDYDSHLLLMQFDYTFGNRKDNDRDMKIKAIDVIGKNFTGYDGNYTMSKRNLNVYRYNIKFINGMTYQIGARDCLEYIANKIEINQYGKNIELLPRFPYTTIDVLFDHYELSGIDTVFKILIVEYCLYNDNPINYLIKIFLENKEHTLLLCKLDVEKAIERLLNTANVSNDGVVETIKNKIARRSKDLLKTIHSFYTQSAKLNCWLEKIYNYAQEHFAFNFVFTRMYMMSNRCFKEYIDKLIQEIGYPLIINKNEKIINTDAETNDFEYLYIIESFINFIKEKQLSKKSCPIARFCKSNYNIKCDEKYSYKKNCNLQCPYKNFLSKNGLSNVKINILCH